MLDATPLSAKHEIEGGVPVEKATSLLDAGADDLVAGNTVFSSENPKQTIKELKAFTR
jgi:ribulose-phosphate 3-epimerase